MLTLYTDGGCQPNPGIGGWAVYSESHKVVVCGYVSESTNSRMELQAMLEALSLSTDYEGLVTIYSDSTYVVKGLTEWMDGWVRRGWKTLSGDVANVDLWKQIKDLYDPTKHKILWVKGHANTVGNNIADSYVGLAIKLKCEKIIKLL